MSGQTAGRGSDELHLRDTDGAISINDSSAMKLMFWLSLVAGLVLYFLADRVAARKQAQAPSVSEGTRWVVAVFAAVLLGALAKVLTDKADGEEPPKPS
jgi:hypothetical protein